MKKRKGQDKKTDADTNIADSKVHVVGSVSGVGSQFAEFDPQYLVPAGILVKSIDGRSDDCCSEQQRSSC